MEMKPKHASPILYEKCQKYETFENRSNSKSSDSDSESQKASTCSQRKRFPTYCTPSHRKIRIPSIVRILGKD